MDEGLHSAPAGQHTLRIPPEILAEIFMHCLPPRTSRPNVVRAPLLLCGICRRWRDIALFTPALWSSLGIDLDALSTENVHGMVFYQIYLSRARGAPLSLYTGQSRRIQALRVPQNCYSERLRGCRDSGELWSLGCNGTRPALYFLGRAPTLCSRSYGLLVYPASFLYPSVTPRNCAKFRHLYVTHRSNSRGTS
ncbi:hypothetical protein DFH06DRAFT_49024 [Mycena polygramma]|nr:hypothetical protein DFH06DRAFT_49024 [Mycena polygramma]